MALFTSDEAFQMALQLEASGQLFYESVAKATEDAAVADMCRNLAAQEQAHAAKFQAMRDATSKASPARRFTPEATEFVQAMLEGKILLKPAEAKRIAAESDLSELLEMAIKMEQDSIRFYSELLSVLDAADAEAVNGIIEEEKRHERELTEAAERVK